MREGARGRQGEGEKDQDLTPFHLFTFSGISMGPVEAVNSWKDLAKELSILLPEIFLKLIAEIPDERIAWKFLSAEEAISFKAELDLRFDYPGREWRGVPFARSTVSEDVACFDLDTTSGEEARVVPIRDWHGPRWEFSGNIKSFEHWLIQDRKGHIT